ncbi:hypothetical protein G6F24_007814 [Rhizopus arrhizus]|nr:hypothetical protein G6F24_007814 [Rhizopus arrhizus]
MSKETIKRKADFDITSDLSKNGKIKKKEKKSKKVKKDKKEKGKDKKKSKEKKKDKVNKEENKKRKRDTKIVDEMRASPQYQSASDSDETDRENKRSKIEAPGSKRSEADQLKSVSKQYESASDSDETDTEKNKSTIAHLHSHVHDQSKSRSKQYESASDSDETDTESNNQKAANATPAERIRSLEKRQVQSKAFRTKEFVNSDSDSDGDDESSDSEEDGNLFVYEEQKKRELNSNRISFRRKLEYNENSSAAVNFKNKASDAFVPTVHQDFFISDSESDTDSNDDYDPNSFPEWQKNFNNKPTKATDWPKTRRFGYADNLKLEKRIKKICRRENISFQEVQEIFSSSRPSKHLEFFRKIARPFPNIPLKALAVHCKEAYNPKRDKKSWTKEEVQRLNELVGIYGKDPKTLSKHLDRTALDISTYMSRHNKDEKTKVVRGRWTKEDDELLAKVIAEQLAKEGKGVKIRFAEIVTVFCGKKSLFQIQNRYKRIQHLIKPDGTLMKDRKATVLEELEYLERLKEQAIKENLVEESQLNMFKHSGFVTSKFYYNQRAKIPGFEKMKLLDILNILIERQKRIVESRREEGLL